MVAIAPFRALRYNPERVRLEHVTSPPHDCIPDDQTGKFLRVPENITHIVLAKRQGGDAVEVAAKHIKEWQESAILLRDQEPGFYLYEVTWMDGDEPRTMRGLMARLALDPSYEHVRRHEKILPRRKEERYVLRQAIETDPEPIWMLYRDPRGWVEEILRSNAYESVLELTDEEGMRHRMYRVDRPQAVEEIIAQFDERNVVIADGHHRYQTAIDHASSTGKQEHDSILVCLVRDNDPGLGLVATHRIVTGVHVDQPIVDWTMEPLAWPNTGDAATAAAALLAQIEDHRQTIMVRQTNGEYEAFRLRHTEEVGPRTLDNLAVSRVHDNLLLQWGVDVAQPLERLDFTRDAAAAIEATATPGTVALLLPPEEIASVLQVAEEGDVMPQKSTYFVPKLRSGLLLSPLDEPRPKGWLGQVEGPGKADFRMPPL